MEEKLVMKCLRCEGDMTFIRAEKIQLGKMGFWFGAYNHLLAGALSVDIYVCARCRKLEFFNNDGAFPEEGSQPFFPEAVDDGRPEEPPEAWYSSDAGEVQQKTCPSCGKRHDFDYPRCPSCRYRY